MHALITALALTRQMTSIDAYTTLIPPPPPIKMVVYVMLYEFLPYLVQSS